MQRIYLDNAATSWPKPDAVYDAVDDYQRNNGAPAGRSAYHHALDVAKVLEDARVRVAELIGAEANQIIFTSSGTDALNLAIHGVLRRGDHVVTSQAEHNSVLRPLRAAEESLGVSVTRVVCDESGQVRAADVEGALNDKTRLVVLTHASNVTGVLQPIEQVSADVREHGALLLVDAAQTLGQVPLTIQGVAADLLAAPGHKGLLGPLGTGILYVGPRAQRVLNCVRQGGTGSSSESDRQPDDMPERLEVGSLNVPGIVGLAASIEFLSNQGVDNIRDHHRGLIDRLVEGLVHTDGVEIYGEADCERVGVVSVRLRGYEPQEAAAILDSGYGIQVRAGYHCAANIHDPIGSANFGGTVRLSVGPFNTNDQIDAVLAALAEIVAAPVR